MDPTAALLDVARTAVVLLVVLTVLVAVHELGHFWAARAFGMHVDAFAVMMGGVRKTDLSSHLERPLAPSARVWLAGWAATALVLAGFMTHNVGVLNAGLVALGLAMPVWVVTRLEALYHSRAGSGVITLVKSWLFALGLILIATRFQGVASTQVLGLLSVASLVGMLFVYYSPLKNKPEDSPQGHGLVEVGEEAQPVLFRPLLATKDKHGTEFSLLLLPLGGFAAIRGMHPKEDGSEVRIEKGFYSKGPVARLVVLFAGPFFSVAFGVLILTGLFAVVGERKLENVPVVGSVGKDGPAATAGLQPGDRILSVDGEPVGTFYDVVVRVRDRVRTTDGQAASWPVRLEVQTPEAPVRTVTLTPVVDKAPTPVLDETLEITEQRKVQAKLGMSPTDRMVPVPLGDAFGRAAKQPVDLVASLAQIAQRPSRASETIGGPGTIAQQTSTAASYGLYGILTLAGLLSISLGVLNLLPIPPMDGGQMVVAFVELLRGGKRLSIGVQHTLQTVGFFLIVALSLAAVTLDIGRFSGGP